MSSSSFQNFKKNSQNNFNSIIQETEKLNQKGSYQDPRYWKLKLDKSGKGKATIRFLPPCENETSFFFLYYYHMFKGASGRTLREVCGSTWQISCPICDAIRPIWDTKDPNKIAAIARPRNRKKGYISNILVIDDPLNPENNGKVFLMEYGETLFKKIMAKMKPENPAMKAVDVTDFWTGRNFAYTASKNGEYNDYDASAFFDESSVLMNLSDTELEKIWRLQYKMADIEKEKKDALKSSENLLAAYRAIDVVATSPQESAMDSIKQQQQETAPFDTKPKFNAGSAGNVNPVGGFAGMKQRAGVATSSNTSTSSDDDYLKSLVENLEND